MANNNIFSQKYKQRGKDRRIKRCDQIHPLEQQIIKMLTDEIAKEIDSQILKQLLNGNHVATICDTYC